MADPSNPLTYFAALIFVGQEWARLVRGRGLSETSHPGANRKSL
jgi:hypothetical protein